MKRVAGLRRGVFSELLLSFENLDFEIREGYFEPIYLESRNAAIRRGRERAPDVHGPAVVGLKDVQTTAFEQHITAGVAGGIGKEPVRNGLTCHPVVCLS